MSLGLLTTDFVWAARIFTISLGVPAGAINPFQGTALNPGKPDSAIVGMLGAAAARVSPATASSRRPPFVAWGMALPSSDNNAPACLATTSIKAGGFLLCDPGF